LEVRLHNNIAGLMLVKKIVILSCCVLLLSACALGQLAKEVALLPVGVADTVAGTKMKASLNSEFNTVLSENSEKQLGNKVCREITTENNRSVTVTAQVEEMSGYTMQLRVLGTESQTVYLNEMMLYAGLTLWAGYGEWYNC